MAVAASMILRITISSSRWNAPADYQAPPRFPDAPQVSPDKIGRDQKEQTS
jgi:hypothetical protein